MFKQKLKVETHSQNTKNSLLLNLPDEVKLHIMSFLGRKGLAKASRVCKELNNLSKDNSLIEVPDYRNPGNSEIIAENCMAITKTSDGLFLGVIERGSPSFFSLLNIDTGAIVLKMAVTLYSEAKHVYMDITPDNKRLIITHFSDADFDPDTGLLYQEGFSYIDIWDLEIRQKISSYNNLSNNSLGTPPFPSVNIVSNEQFLVSFRGFNILLGNDRRIFSCEINKENKHIFVAHDSNHDGDGQYYATCISPDKKLYARTINNNLNIYSAVDGKKIKSILLPEDITRAPFFKIQFLNDNQTICMIGNESFVTKDDNQHDVELKKPYLMKVNCVTEQIKKFYLKLPQYDISTIGSFTFLHNNHIALLDNRWLNLDNEKVLIFDLNTQELVKSLVTTSKTVVTNNDGSQLYILNEKDQLTKIAIPIITKQLWLKEEGEKMELEHNVTTSFNRPGR